MLDSGKNQSGHVLEMSMMRWTPVVAMAVAAMGCRDGASRASPPTRDASLPLASGTAVDPSSSSSSSSSDAIQPRSPAVWLGNCTAATDETTAGDRRLDALLDEAAAHLARAAWADAFTCADMASDLLPRSIEAHHLRAAALAGADHHEAAAIAYGIALALDPEDPETLRAAADFYLNITTVKTKDTTALGLELARRGSARALARRRGQRDLRGQLAVLEAQAHNDLGQSDDALERATEALRLSADLIDGIHERGVALFNLGRFAEARGQFERVLGISPDDAYAHQLLGLTLEQIGDADVAASHVARASVLAPDQFPLPVVASAGEIEAVVARVVAGLQPDRQARLRNVSIQVVEVPDAIDLSAVTPPFPPTILGLYRGLPLGVDPLPGEDVPARAILLYRRNLLRAVRTRTELVEQIERTLLHEIGHLEGLDEDDLRRRDLE
jgi:tetratricopeptide (TPR) repeat protein